MRAQMKQPRFNSGNAGFFVANVFVELLRAQHVDEAPALVSARHALGAAP
jgi:hypothetical protein